MLKKNLVSTREPLDQPVKIFTALAERLHSDALVLAVGAHVVHVEGEPGMPVGRNAGIAQITPSDAAAPITGTTGTPRQNSAEVFSMVLRSSSSSADGALSRARWPPTTEIWSSPNTRMRVAFTSSTFSVGIMRQLTMA